MHVSKAEVLDSLRTRGDDEQVRRAESELPERVDTEEHAELLRSLGLDRADVAALGSDTGLGSGQASGLGVNFQSEPESLDPRDE
ncbi:hypothetical protein [Aquipuribacter nitratireducens]|uniref:Uncharacterized protein n=1 Tax=Aquipuribacter nitratireducens TaxID=650104 RepID=A0ABW0GH89_9MICO